jgi:hypothetical protein
VEWTFIPLKAAEMLQDAISKDCATLCSLIEPNDSELQKQVRIASLIFVRNLTGVTATAVKEKYLLKEVTHKETKKHRSNSTTAGRIVPLKAPRGEVMAGSYGDWVKYCNNLLRTVILTAQEWTNTTLVSPTTIFSFLEPDQVNSVVALYPAEPKLMELAQEALESDSVLPSKANVKASVNDEVYTQLADHQIMKKALVSKLRWPAADNQEDQPTKFHSLRKSPELWARLMALILFAHSGTDADTILRRARAIANGGKFSKPRSLFPASADAIVVFHR